MNDINEKVIANSSLVHLVLNRLNIKDYHTREELYQAGLIGLWKALEKYNPEKGKLSPYACRKIRWEISRLAEKIEKNKKVSSQSDLSGIYFDSDNFWEYESRDIEELEKEVLDLRLEGRSFQNISDETGLSFYFVKKFYKNALSKMKKANI